MFWELHFPDTREANVGVTAATVTCIARTTAGAPNSKAGPEWILFAMSPILLATLKFCLPHLLNSYGPLALAGDQPFQTVDGNLHD